MKTSNLIITTIIAFGWLSNLCCQTDYELLYLNNEFHQIKKIASKQANDNDYYWFAVVLKKQGKLDSCINVLEKGLSKYPNNDRLSLIISNVYMDIGDYNKAAVILEKFKSMPDKCLDLIKILEFREEYQKAIKMLLSLYQKDTTNIQYLIHLGNNFYRLDNLNQAIEYYGKAYHQYPDNLVVAERLAKVYSSNEDFESSINICNSILKNDSANIKFLKISGISYLKIKDFENAEKKFNKLYSLGDSSGFTLKYLGVCQFNNYNVHVAREHLLLAFEKDSNDMEICFYLGKAFLNSRFPEKGIYYLERMESLLQPKPELLASMHKEKHSIYSALKIYDKALEELLLAYEYSKKTEYLFYIASLYSENLDDKKKALDYYNLFLEKLPPKPENSGGITQKDQMVISLRNIAERNIKTLREELFFEGELK